MPKRPITALLAALALLAVAPGTSPAQDLAPTPTPSATPTATAAQEPSAEAPANASRGVRSIYDDYSGDGVIDVCEHTRADLQKTLDTIEPDFDRDFPDFREAVEAGIQRHDNDRCDDDDARATPTATATPAPSATSAPSATAAPTASVEPGALPPRDSGGGDDGGGALPPVEDGSLPPQEDTPEPQGTTQPQQQPPAATPAPVTTPAPTPTTVVVSRSRTDRLLVPGILVAVALLGAAALAATMISGRSPRLRHAWDEAAFRARGTWADFSDWLRLGR
jgi:hypothetical protein